MKNVLLLVDDSVFLQHSLGAAVILSNCSGVQLEVVLGGKCDTTLVSYVLLNKLDSEKKLVLSEKPLRKDYDVMLTQWGPPPSFLRRFSSVKHNILSHTFRGLKGSLVAIPHGFEIKRNHISYTKRMKVRSFVSFGNPFRDYSRYSKYFFDSSNHLERYGCLLSSIDTPICGSLTFNKYILRHIKSLLDDVVFYKDIVIMPKIAHVPNAREIFEKSSRTASFVLHPRELDVQREMAFQCGVNENQIVSCLDLLKIGEITVVRDFGTSVSLIATALGATLKFNNLTNKPLLFDVEDEAKVQEVVSAGHENYSAWFLEELFV